jgi:ABC-type phosphate/phosphonate transport system substrate-binding protein
MPHDVFISYSTKDRVIADAVVSNFEANGIRCWYAPRDIDPGDDWGEAITRGIDACSVFLLIFSGNANASKHVLDELYYGLAEEKIVLPFRVENLDPSGAMRLHLSSLHWLDAHEPTWETHIDQLFETASANLARAVKEDRKSYTPTGGKRGSTQGKAGLTKIITGIIVAAFLTVSTVWGIPWIKALTAAPAIPTETTPTESPRPTEIAQVAPEPTIVPTSTIEVNTLGTVANPISWMFVPPEDTDFEEINTAMEIIVAAFEKSNPELVLNLIPAIDPAAIITAMCDGQATIGSYSAFAYMAASEKECANVEYIWAAYEDIKYSGMLVSNPGQSSSGWESVIEGAHLCIPSYDSNSGWLLPSLELRAAGVDLDQLQIVDAGDHQQVLVNVYDGVLCDFGTVYYDARQTSWIPDVENAIAILAKTVAIRQHNISVDPGIHDEITQLLRQFFAELASNEDALTSLALISGYPELTPQLIAINHYYYDGLADLIARSGLSAEEVMEMAQ